MRYGNSRINGEGSGVVNSEPQLLFDKIWNSHCVASLGSGYDLIYIDRHMMHELASDVAFAMLSERGQSVRRPELTFATHDHVVSTAIERRDDSLPKNSSYITTLRDNTARHGIELFDLHSRDQGIVHVVAPELAIALPGQTFVCGDSHTCTVGGVGTASWGIGSSDVAHVLATQTLVQRRPSVFRIECNGCLPNGVVAKDLILALIGRYGAEAGTGHAIEYCGDTISTLPIEGRLTLCNLSIEMGARIGQVAPDDTTFEYLNGRRFAPTGLAWETAVGHWRDLNSDDGAPPMSSTLMVACPIRKMRATFKLERVWKKLWRI
jgi:3-isopropylmalate/(R)-2-methylmalate dehydratase large subunit